MRLCYQCHRKANCNFEAKHPRLAWQAKCEKCKRMRKVQDCHSYDYRTKRQRGRPGEVSL